MRHRYDTRGIILARSPLGEANALITLLTPELGLVRARAQSVRTSGAKLAAALTTLSESSLILVRGKEGWRLAGAVADTQWFLRLPHTESRERIARVTGLLLRLVAGEAPDSELYPVMRDYLEALATLPLQLHEAAEILAVLRFLEALGLDTGDASREPPTFTPETLSLIARDRTAYVARINAGIAASGL